MEQGLAEILANAIKIGKELTQLRQLQKQGRLTPQQEKRITELVKAEEKIVEDFNNFIESEEVEALIAQLTPKTRKPDLVDDLEDFIALQDNLKDLQQNAVLLYPLIFENRLELILTNPYSSPIRRTVQVSNSELKQTIIDFRKALRGKSSDIKIPAQKLYNWLIKPLENDLKVAEAETIIYVPDGQLRYIPLSALYDGEKWLTQRFRINNITASSLTDLNSQPQPKIQVLAAAFANGYYEFEIEG
ncbi:MAG: CHAT domain-containing protein [Moorea sp. SIO2B7]|nr:CHAT domain-containing protein [Moorena sp. SIO2B7]